MLNNQDRNTFKNTNTQLKKTEIGEIPEEWSLNSIKELVLNEPNSLTAGPFGTIFKAKDFRDSGIPIVQIRHVTEAGFSWGNKVTYMDKGVYEMVHKPYTVRSGDLLITKMGEPPGIACLYPDSESFGMVTPDVIKVTCDPEKVDTYFVMCVYQSPQLRKRILDLTKGGTRSRVSLDEFYALLLPIPPFPEQKKIAAIMRSVDETIASTQAVIDQTRKVKQGLLQQLLTRGIGHTRFKESAIGKIPEVWEVVHLIEHITLPTGQVDPKQSPYKKLPLIAPNHIESGTGRLLEKVSAEAQRAISGKYLFQEGDVIYSKIRPYLRKATLANEKGLCSADMYPLRVKDSLLPRFLLALVLSEDFSRFAESKSMRTGIPKLNREELGEYICALPPVNEQKKMVSIFESIDQDIETNLQSIVSLEILKRGLMQDLLTGKVRVGCTS